MKIRIPGRSSPWMTLDRSGAGIRSPRGRGLNIKAPKGAKADFDQAHSKARNIDPPEIQRHSVAPRPGFRRNLHRIGYRIRLLLFQHQRFTGLTGAKCPSELVDDGLANCREILLRVLREHGVEDLVFNFNEMAKTKRFELQDHEGREGGFQ